jgi:hypothetical protein
MRIIQIPGILSFGHDFLILDIFGNVQALNHECGRYICPDLAVSLTKGIF